MRRCTRLSALLIAAASTAAFCAPARAGKPVDLARYVCTRTNNGRPIAGSRLAARGFVIAARFRHLDVALIDPMTGVRANCVRRRPQVW